MEIRNSIMSNIPLGMKNAIPQQRLWQLLGINDRQGRKIIILMRRDNYPILTAPCGGYFVPDDENGVDEATQFIRSMSKQAISRFESIKAAKNYVRTHDKQIDIDSLINEV